MSTALKESPSTSWRPLQGGGRQTLCRFCGTPLSRTLVDLGMSPLCESYIHPDRRNQMEPFYPLHAMVCDNCLLVQLDQYVAADDIFSDYAYFSSYSESWLKHASNYCDHMQQRFGIGEGRFVVEVASNDGYLLQYFVKKGVRVLGVEPAANVAEVARQKGVDTLVRFFGVETARLVAAEHGKPDLLLGNNVLAHVPNLNDFVAGMKILLSEDGLITAEFPHLMRLMQENQFDTIYHEHFCYFSFIVIEKVLAHHGLTIFDVEELPTHGGSLRIYACHTGCPKYSLSPRVPDLRRREMEAGYARPETYSGIRTDFLDYTVDRNPIKHGKFTPGTRIPIFPPSKIDETRPDYILILPWNLKDEIVKQMAHVKEWGCKFVVPIPEATIVGE
jgi:SAM-dependent methyltransferase